MSGYVLELSEVDHTRAADVGGKGAALGELSRIDGIRVPTGFCVTTDAFRRVMATASIDDRLHELSRLQPDDLDGIRAGSAEVRRILEQTAVPEDVRSAITRALGHVGEDVPCAVRSSATAEDLPTASFAGQQDSFLNVTGREAILEHVSRCWASLFSERAVTYRLRNGFDHRQVQMAVVVQRMVAADAAGVAFTADPVTGNRRIVSVEAVPGLGEGLVSGHVNADAYTVRDGEVTTTVIADEPALTEAQVRELAQIARRIEAHFGAPQDIEWCLADDVFSIVQSRPITTLFPIPEAGDDGNHVYISVGHQQMMTDPMTPLGLSVWQLTTPRPMAEAGGRLFVDVTRLLGSPDTQSSILEAMRRSDPLIGDALQTVIDRGDFIPPVPDTEQVTLPRGVAPGAPIETDPAIPAGLIADTQESLTRLKREIAGKAGPELLDFILADFQELRRILFNPESLPVIMAGMDGSRWLNEHLEAWLGERNAVDVLTQSVPHNITSEMGLALLDVADVIRPYPEVVTFLGQVHDEGFLDELAVIPGGQQARDAIHGYLATYGMRCVGEIDITRARWSERPSSLVPMILANVRNFEPGAGPRRFEAGRREAEAKREELLARLRELPDGEQKADEAERTIDQVRTFAGYREYPKYGMVSRYWVYKQALLAEAARLVAAGVLDEVQDIFFLRLQELHEVVRTHQVDEELITQRREAFASYGALTPPRVLTSDGEAITGTYRRHDLPAGALAGLPVSAGTVEGRARVIVDMAQADLEPGDILVTAYTDPSWTPLFVAVDGLVTEVGGLMTHGAVIAREYGLPAVVGVEHATEVIRDGQRIRVHGTDGYVEILRP